MPLAWPCWNSPRGGGAAGCLSAPCELCRFDRAALRYKLLALLPVLVLVLTPILFCFVAAPPRLHALRSRDTAGPGASIRAYALHLAADKSTTFAQNVDNFIACTKDSRESRPQVVMRNMRQFMSGMKNYLVKHGEREFDCQVEKERGKVRRDSSRCRSDPSLLVRLATMFCGFASVAAES